MTKSRRKKPSRPTPPHPILDSNADITVQSSKESGGQKSQALVRRQTVSRATSSGPLPTAAEFERYDLVLPGSAERILKMAEVLQQHGMSWENDALQASKGDVKRGQWFGFTLALACILASVVLALSGHNLVAAILAGVAATGLVGHFLYKN